jgi:hypothetical protein
LRQICPGLQIFPQPPQFLGSVSTFTHALPQRLVSAPHAQVPLLHDAPLTQARPHWPQLTGSICRSVQALPQSCWAPVQVQREVTQL